MKKIFSVVALTLSLFPFEASATGPAEGTSVSAEGDEVSTDIAAPRRWKAAASSYYYSFEGTRAAQADLYRFGSTSLLMQLLTLQYQASPSWTFVALGQHLDNYVETTMPIPGAGNLEFKDRTLGWGDVLLDAVRPLYLSPSFLLFGDLGVSVPTGSINKKNPSGGGRGNYAYNMQLGSGTWDLQLGATGIFVQRHFQAGTHLSSYQRIGENRNGYRLGNLYKADGWLDLPIAYGITPRLVGYYKVKQAIHGADPTLGRNVYTEYYHHDQQNWDLSAAVKFERAIGPAQLVAEAGTPLYQGARNSDQVVVSTNYYGTVGVSGTF